LALAGGWSAFRGLEEERLLAYGAMTRALEDPVLAWPRSRHGRRGRRASRFAAEAMA
jgi:superfamily I DNA/RNA helicase